MNGARSGIQLPSQSGTPQGDGKIRRRALQILAGVCVLGLAVWARSCYDEPDAALLPEDLSRAAASDPSPLGAIRSGQSSDLSYFVDAAKTGQIGAVKALLDSGVKIDYANSSGETALLAAVAGGRDEVTNELIARGADVNAMDKHGGSVLLYAIESCGKLDGCKDHTIVDRLLAKGADPNPPPRRFSASSTPICSAISYDALPVVRELFQRGARLQRDGCLPAPFVMTKGVDMVQALLGAGLTPQASDVYLHLNATPAEKEAAAAIEAHLSPEERLALQRH